MYSYCALTNDRAHKCYMQFKGPFASATEKA